MFIFCLEIQLSLPSHSLKEKRGIVKSILARARNRFNVACAEVDRQDNASVAVLGFVTISPDKNIRGRPWNGWKSGFTKVGPILK